MDIPRLRPLDDSLYLSRGRPAAASSYKMAIEFNFLSADNTLRGLYIELMLLESFENEG